MTWSVYRQILYLFVFLGFFLVFGFLIIYPNFNKNSTCFDNRKNGNELDVDCGGSCKKACSFEVDKISISWARAFEVVPGRYNALAYFENHNANLAVKKVNYRFRFADENNLYIGKRDGSTYVPPSGKFAIFEPAIDTGHSIPVYTTFEFTQNPEWLNVSEKIRQIKILTSNINLINTDTNPTLSVTLKNNSSYEIKDINVIVILYDSKNNAINISKTYLENLLGEEEKDVYFTWPQPFSNEVIVKEVIPFFNIFSVNLK